MAKSSQWQSKKPAANAKSRLNFKGRRNIDGTKSHEKLGGSKKETSGANKNPQGKAADENANQYSNR